MGSRLTNNISSDYFNAANHLRPKWKKMKIITYVESYDDIAFWRDILSPFENDNFGFEIVLPSRNSLVRGKKSAIMNNLGINLGTSLIACVDADYDYLMQNHNEFSQSMLTNPFVIHTFVYAIENYHCFAPSLHKACTTATLNDHHLFDFETYLIEYSKIIYNIFIWQIWLHREGKANEFPLTSFNNIISAKRINIQNPQETLERIRRETNRKMASLQQNHPEAKGKIQPLKEELLTLGVTPENTYLYIQGHNLFENVVLPVLIPVCTTLRKAREKEIMSYAVHQQQMQNELSSYQHSQSPIEEIIRRNSDFKSAPQYTQLMESISKLMDKFE
ncbi:MAG: DUF4435 domain-containing protein [Bacteroidaceae bacterium]|nr:DUF4435 domain-containing protein [Bacteroidaceae bacterium]